MRILIVDNNFDLDSWGSRDLRNSVALTPGALSVTRRGPQQDLPLSVKGYDRVIISGSKASCLEVSDWTKGLDRLILTVLDAGIPLLGVCYGHQALARALGGVQVLRKAAEPELGWTQIEIISESRLFLGLPERFVSFSSHYEEVSVLPKGTRLLARSERCGIQAFECDGGRAFGIQFHPEKERQAGLIMWDRLKKEKKERLFLGPKDGTGYYDKRVQELIFGNFLK